MGLEKVLRNSITQQFICPQHLQVLSSAMSKNVLLFKRLLIQKLQIRSLKYQTVSVIQSRLHSELLVGLGHGMTRLFGV